MKRQKNQVHAHGGPYYPMMNYRGLSAIPNAARLNGEDLDATPRQFRRNVNASGLQDVQILNGLWRGVGRGVRAIPGFMNYGNAYLYASNAIIPGQQRGDAGGFQQRGPSPYNVQNWLNNGPGSQPVNPGGPGRIAGPNIINPMTG